MRFYNEDSDYALSLPDSGDTIDSLDSISSYASNAVKNKEVTIRKEFPEAWIWEEIDARFVFSLNTTHWFNCIYIII